MNIAVRTLLSRKQLKNWINMWQTYEAILFFLL